jgi:hypothetical protein
MGTSDIPLALRVVFAERGYAALAGILFLFSLLLYVSIPVFTVPGNSYAFFIASTPALELALIAGISALMGVVLSMQAYCWKNSIRAASSAGIGFAGFVSGAVSAIFASATCASCVSAVFSFIGFGGVLFLMEHKAEVTAFTGGLVFVSLYFTSKRIAGRCESCELPAKRKSK